MNMPARAFQQDVIHRLVERRAAEDGEATAWIDLRGRLTYRELNARANSVARRLVSQGFRRGSRADVPCEATRDRVIALLGVLKAGGCYGTLPPGVTCPDCAIVIRGSRESHGETLRLDDVLCGSCIWSPNLPVLMRPADAAFVIGGGASSPEVVVPHGTLTALFAAMTPRTSRSLAGWSQCAEGDWFAVWMTLMSGATVDVRHGAGRAA